MSNRLAFAVLAVACISAAAGGGFLATRQNAIPVPTAAQSANANVPAPTIATPAPSETGPAAAAADKPAVNETEAVIGDKAPNSRGSQGSQGSQGSRVSQGSRASKGAAGSPGAQGSQGSKTANASKPTGTLASSWPSSAAQPPASATPPASVAPETQAPRPDEHIAQEPPRAPEPSRPTFEELTISRDSVIGLQTENRISTDTAKVEDRVDARVTRDVRVGDRIAIPSGARLVGTVTQVERGGKFKEQAKLGIRFNTIVLADGTRVAISTETIMRFGEAPGNKAAQKVGGAAVGGAILGAILGGAKGAAIGATAGAGGGAAVVQAGDQSTVVLQPGTPLTARILSPVTITVEKQ